MRRKSISELTSNQFYGGLNRRYDSRVKRLRQMGLVYNQTGNCWSKKYRKGTIDNCLVAQAHNRCFIDYIAAFRF